jgi:hypothetical protein
LSSPQFVVRQSCRNTREQLPLEVCMPAREFTIAQVPVNAN